MITGSGPIFKIKFFLTVFEESSTDYSGSVPVYTISGLFDDIDDLPIMYGFIVI